MKIVAMRKRWMLVAALSAAGVAELWVASERTLRAEPKKGGKSFDGLADPALEAMKKRATQLQIGGVAVVAYFEGDTVQAWSSKMVVVGRMKDAPSAGNNGANLLGIAYTKASEMAETLKDSGSDVRPPMIGEYGWQGGVITKAKHGYAIAAFSGGKSADDVEVSKAGVGVLKDVE